jgi:hypothetical protein
LSLWPLYTLDLCGPALALRVRRVAIGRLGIICTLNINLLKAGAPQHPIPPRATSTGRRHDPWRGPLSTISHQQLMRILPDPARQQVADRAPNGPRSLQRIGPGPPALAPFKACLWLCPVLASITSGPEMLTMWIIRDVDNHGVRHVPIRSVEAVPPRRRGPLRAQIYRFIKPAPWVDAAVFGPHPTRRLVTEWSPLLLAVCDASQRGSLSLTAKLARSSGSIFALRLFAARRLRRTAR